MKGRRKSHKYEIQSANPHYPHTSHVNVAACLSSLSSEAETLDPWSKLTTYTSLYWELWVQVKEHVSIHKVESDWGRHWNQLLNYIHVNIHAPYMHTCVKIWTKIFWWPHVSLVSLMGQSMPAELTRCLWECFLEDLVILMSGTLFKLKTTKFIHVPMHV